MWSHFSRPACCYSFVGKRYSLSLFLLVSSPSRLVSRLSPFLSFSFYLFFSLSLLATPRCSTSTFSDEPRCSTFGFASFRTIGPRSLSRIYFCIHSCNRASATGFSLQTVRVLNCALQQHAATGKHREFTSVTFARAHRFEQSADPYRHFTSVFISASRSPSSSPRNAARFYATRYEF